MYSRIIMLRWKRTRIKKSINSSGSSSNLVYVRERGSNADDTFEDAANGAIDEANEKWIRRLAESNFKNLLEVTEKLQIIQNRTLYYGKRARLKWPVLLVSLRCRVAKVQKYSEIINREFVFSLRGFSKTSQSRRVEEHLRGGSVYWR